MTAHRFRWEYVKDASSASGSDTSWLAWVLFPGLEVVTFQNGLPAGWTTGGTLAAPWGVVTDPTHTDEGLCLTKAVKAGATLDSGSSHLEVVKTVPADGTLYDFRWTSSEPGSDGLRMAIDLFNDGSYDFVSPLESGEADFVTGVAYPAAYPESIAVAASADRDCRSYYSQFGPQIAFAGTSSGGIFNSAIETTDRSLTDGYDPTGNYTSGFGGTSSATPLSSGIAGLVLTIRPGLKSAQVRALLGRSTDKVGPEPYLGQGGGRNDRYGYGRINALKAVNAAAEWIFGDGFQ